MIKEKCADFEVVRFDRYEEVEAVEVAYVYPARDKRREYYYDYTLIVRRGDNIGIHFMKDGGGCNSDYGESLYLTGVSNDEAVEKAKELCKKKYIEKHEEFELSSNP